MTKYIDREVEALYNNGRFTVIEPPQEKVSQMLKEGLHWCSDCEQFLPIDIFPNKQNKKSNICYPCHKIREGNRGPIRRRHIIKLLGEHCCRCGYHEFSHGLVFHHVNPEQKGCNNLHLLPLGEALIEADKCILLCHNCHHAYHARDWTANFVKSDKLGWLIGPNI